MRIINSRLCLIVAGVSLVAGAAFAQTTSPAPKDSTPDAKPIAPGDNLSKKLNEIQWRHPSERGGPRHPEAGAQDRGYERGPAARDFGRRLQLQQPALKRRSCENYDAIVDAACAAWRKLIASTRNDHAPSECATGLTPVSRYGPIGIIGMSHWL